MQTGGGRARRVLLCRQFLVRATTHTACQVASLTLPGLAPASVLARLFLISDVARPA